MIWADRARLARNPLGQPRGQLADSQTRADDGQTKADAGTHVQRRTSIRSPPFYVSVIKARYTVRVVTACDVLSGAREWPCR